MYRFLMMLAAVLIVAACTAPPAVAGSAFGHGYAWTNDDDGDGIPNGLDKDWIRPADGTGYKFRHGSGLSLAPKAGPNATGNLFQYRQQYREKRGGGNPAGTCVLKTRLRVRDGSCR